MRNKLLVLATVAIASMSILAGCAKKQENTLRVGLEAAYAPFNWTQIDDSNGAVPIEGTKEYAGGYDVEIAKRVAESLGKELVIVKTEWLGLVPALQSGMIDSIFAGMSPTADRKESIDFSDSYYSSDLVMVMKKDSQFASGSSIHDFANAKITAQLNTFHYSVIEQMTGATAVTAMEDFAAMRVALDSGIIDGYISEKPEGISATAANPNFIMVEFNDGFETSPEDTEIAVGIKKGSKLNEEINQALSKISEEERIEIMNQAIANQPSSND